MSAFGLTGAGKQEILKKQAAVQSCGAPNATCAPRVNPYTIVLCRLCTTTGMKLKDKLCQKHLRVTIDSHLRTYRHIGIPIRTYVSRYMHTCIHASSVLGFHSCFRAGKKSPGRHGSLLLLAAVRNLDPNQ